jgi:hypothetical protein
VILLAVVALLAGWRLSRSRFDSPSGFGSSFSRVGRIVSALLGIGLAAAIGYATLASPAEAYRLTKPAGELALQVPDRTISPDPEGHGRQNLDFTTGTLHLHGILCRRVAGMPYPVAVAGSRIAWPGERGKEVRLDFGNTTPVYCTVKATPLSTWWDNRESTKVLVMHTAAVTRMESPSQNTEVATSGFWDERGKALSNLHATVNMAPLTLANQARPTTYEVWAFFSMAPPDTATHETSAMEFLAARADNMGRKPALAVGNFAYKADVDAPGIHTPANCIKMFEHLGPPMAMLFLAAVLGSGAFRRRQVALAALGVAAVLYAAALDRAVLGIHARHARNPQETTETRLVAIDRTKNTFFFAKTAKRMLEEIAEDKAVPVSIREAAARRSFGLRWPL